MPLNLKIDYKIYQLSKVKSLYAHMHVYMLILVKIISLLQHLTILLPSQFHNDAYMVHGYIFQVWIHRYLALNNPSGVQFVTDFNSSLTKHIAILLMFGLSSKLLFFVVKIWPEFVQLLGLKQSLMPSRNNRFLICFNGYERKPSRLGFEFGPS